MIAELRKPEVRHKILEEASEGPLVLSVRTTNSLPPFLPSSLQFTSLLLLLGFLSEV